MTNALPTTNLNEDRFAALTHKQPAERRGVLTHATRDHAEIRQWAAAHGAEPATGEETMSGPAKIVVHDGGVGIRFNFPGFAPFRPIEWTEWFDHFDQHGLLFVFEEQDTAQVAARAHELFRSRGSQPGRDRDDWFRAEREVRDASTAGSQPLRYAVVTGASTDGDADEPANSAAAGTRDSSGVHAPVWHKSTRTLPGVQQ